MCKITIDLVSPAGVPVTLQVDKTDDHQTIIELLDRAEKIGAYFSQRGWNFAHLEATGPSAAELAQAPTFAGYPCSPTVDERGFPTWLIVDGKQAQRREKQGDTWYSVRLPDGSYAQVVRIPKGERVPEVNGL
ncbi:MAG: hypothetical protein IAE81_24290 [Caldilineaceae bacterium]|jgi:hypothetical protein|nr:hypothetical protein [Caldilineaceae bacterium]